MDKSGENSDNDKTAEENLDFNSEQNISRPMTRALKKLIDHKNATQLAINVLCDLSKKHCAMCEWEQECSDNPLLFDPVFARRYINERKNWLINKQSMCAKCKLQLGEHLISHNVQNAANTIRDSSDSLQYLISQQFFDEATSNDSIKIQYMISDARSDSDANDNLINGHKNDEIF